MPTLIRGAGLLHVKFPWNLKFVLYFEPDLLKRKSESKAANFELEKFEGIIFSSVSLLSKSKVSPDTPNTLILQSLTFFSSVKYVLKVVHHTSTPTRIK